MGHLNDGEEEGWRGDGKKARCINLIREGMEMG